MSGNFNPQVSRCPSAVSGARTNPFGLQVHILTTAIIGVGNIHAVCLHAYMHWNVECVFDE